MTGAAAGPDAQHFGEAWIATSFAEVDRMDPDGLMAWYADDGRFRLAGETPIQGKTAIAAVLARFYASIRSMRHNRTGVWIDAVTIPAVSVLRVKEGRVQDFRFLMDATPLYGASS